MAPTTHTRAAALLLRSAETGEPPPLEVTFDVVDRRQHQWLIRLERPPALSGE